MRELRVEDALLYLDQVKMEFGDRPHIYNEFLDIMKTFKTQQIDTPGVIRRVSNLFQGNRKLVLGFNTFLPEGYKIEVPMDGDGPPVAVYTTPGSNVTHRLDGSDSSIPLAAAKPPPVQDVKPPARKDPPLPPPAAYAGPTAHHPLAPVPSQSRHSPAMPRGPPPMRYESTPTRGVPAPIAPAPVANTQQPTQQPPQPQEAAPGPLEFDHAINYVTTIKKRFSNEPETYKKFLEILHTYQKEQRGIKEVLEDVSTLFADHPDLLKEFTYFLPDAVQEQAKTQLDAAALAAEQRQREKAQKAITAQAQSMQRQAVQPPPPRRSDPSISVRPTERESTIMRSTQFGTVSFAPVRPPKQGEPTLAQMAQKHGRPTSIPLLPMQPNATETAFFLKVKRHLNRKELQAEKYTGSKRHTPYVEFLKCLHMFGAGIVTKEELVLLLRGLFMQGHAPKTGQNSSTANPEITQEANELLREFEQILLSRGPYANQESAYKDKCEWGALQQRDFDFTDCERPTPSYRTYPETYPYGLYMKHPGQEKVDEEVLNKTLVCVVPENGLMRNTRSREEYNGIRRRHNVYEEAMARIEDERYEMDMIIERNAQAMRQIEPFAEEAQTLREREEKDGQPVGRLQYKLNKYALNTIHINAIGRLYGDQGDEMLQYVMRYPLVALPIVYQRLKQKDAEWRKLKDEMMKRWNEGNDANYEGTLDTLCYFYRREIERTFSKALMIEECRRARAFYKHPNKIADHPATRPFLPKFGLRCSDPGAILYQPFVAVDTKVNHCHKDAFSVVSQYIKSDPNLSALDRERIGRIWAEFVVPWFAYPAYWVLDEIRTSYQGGLNSRIVRFIPGQQVVTIFGKGTVLSFTEASNTCGAKYRVKLPFAVSYLSPSALLYAIQPKDATYVRRDGVMVRETLSTDSFSPKLDGKYQLLFGNENIYLFLRKYVLLCSILTDTHEYCRTHPAPEDPAKFYRNPIKKQTESPRLDYSAVMAALTKVLCNKMEHKEFEALGRKVTKAKVHQISALPKLIERCAHVLINIAKEDSLLCLYDYCQLRAADPVAVRAHCFPVASDAFYRIQYDAESGTMYFCYLSKNQELFLTPREEEDGGATYEETHEDMNGETGEEAMEEESDPIEEYEDDEMMEPEAKKLKIQQVD